MSVDGAEQGPSPRDEREVHRRLMRFGEAETLATPTWERADTSVREIEAELVRLWDIPGALADDDGSAQVTEKGMPHARASVLNLIVMATHTTAADRIVATMMALGIQHPSRAVVLVARPGEPGPALGARITTHCHPASTAAGRICYEEVVLTVRGEAANHLGSIVAPLLIHDLPTYVWWPGDPPFADPVFDQVVEISDRLIIDSSDFAELLAGYRRVGALRRRSGVGDLSWERLTRTQELTAEFFDTPRFRRYLPNLNRLRIGYAVPPGDAAAPRPPDVAPGCPQPMAQAMLYAGWLASRLNWRRYRVDTPLHDGGFRLTLEGRYEMVDLQLTAVATDEVSPGEIVSVSMRVLGEAGAAEFLIDRAGHQATVATNADGMTAFLRRVATEERPEPELLSQQLIVEGNDPVYEAAVRAAAVFLDAVRDDRAA